MAIWDFAERADAEEIFAKIGQLLIAKAVDPDVARKFAEASAGRSDFKLTENGFILSIETEDNRSILNKHLRIQHPKDAEPSDF